MNKKICNLSLRKGQIEAINNFLVENYIGKDIPYALIAEPNLKSFTLKVRLLNEIEYHKLNKILKKLFNGVSPKGGK